MITPTIAELLGLLFTYGPQAVAMAQKLIADIEAGKGQTVVTAIQIQELLDLGQKTAASYLDEAGGPPPVAPAPTPAASPV